MSTDQAQVKIREDAFPNNIETGDQDGHRKANVALGGEGGADERDPNKKGGGGDESSSTGSSSGGKSGSREGYSADCSASDQSSDDSGGAGKGESKGLNLSVKRMNLGSETASDVATTSTPVSKEPNDTQISRDTSVSEQLGGKGIAHQLRSNHGQHLRQAHLSSAGGINNTRALDTSSVASSNISVPKDKNGAVNLDAIKNYKKEIEKSATFQPGQTLPQWNGVRISHPMDARIDLSTVEHLMGAGMRTLHPTAAVEASPLAKVVREAGRQAEALAANAGEEKVEGGTSMGVPTENTAEAPSVDSYFQLFEVVRPFFQAMGIASNEHHLLQNTQQVLPEAPPRQVGLLQGGDFHMPRPPMPQDTKVNIKNNNGSTSEAASSEGFTSFFTTTQSESPETTDIDKQKQRKDEDKSAERNGIAGNDDGGTNTDSSSMVVLARVKKKHRQKSSGEDQSNSNTSASSGEKQVRIAENPNHQRRHRENHANQPAGQPLNQEAGHGDAAGAGPAEDDQVDNSGSSDVPAQPIEDGLAGEDSTSSSNIGNAQQGEVFGVPPRIVTDVGSSSNRTDSNKDTTASGSGGNTGSGSNPGSSGSNQGSSGSGNEGRGSSEELPQDNTGIQRMDASESANSECQKSGPSNEIRRHSAEAATHLSTHHQNEDDNQTRATREQKLLDKKRKRIEMRREYEAQQQSESSESIHEKSELLRPGKPVAMDQVMVFSKIARIVVQATPPFLVVHSNAAYTRLTGVESHTIVGKPISQLLATKESTAKPSGVQQADTSSTESGNPQGSDDVPMARPVPKINHKDPSIERIVASCGSGQLQILYVTVEPHQMVGKNVTVTKENPRKPAATTASRDETGNDSSLTSSWDGRFFIIACRVSIAPIVTGGQIDTSGLTGKEAEPRAKRRKHSTLGCETDKHEKLPARTHQVTHFVIQLEAQSGDSNKPGGQESLSSHSTSVEARMLGLAKAELQVQRSVVGPPHGAPEPQIEVDDEADASESTEVQDPVSAIG